MNWEIFWIGLGAFVLFSVGFYLFMIVYASHRIYIDTLKRKTKDQWGRVPSCQTQQHLQMDGLGLAWQREHDAYKQDVQIENNGLRLYGEYYDFGFQKAVLILSGRTESLRYGYYFAKPYQEQGYNVLVIDSRCHGKSDGEFNTVGFEESKDAVAWATFLAQEKQMESIVFHGICIGSAAGMLAITSKECPAQVVGMVTEGMFTTFGESMKNHLIERNRLWFPVMQCIDYWMKRYTGHSMNNGPVDVVHNCNKPLLMLQSKEDQYSTPENAKILFERCGSEEKQLVLFEKGEHSMLRITNTNKYDIAITGFLAQLNK